MVDIQISNFHNLNLIDDKEIEKLVKFSISLCEELQLSGKIISIAISDEDTVAQLNKYYKNKDGSTDVLSFPLSTLESKEPILGEIIIDVSKANQQAQEYGHSLIKELKFLILHGILHLIGYDHDQEHRGAMRQKEKQLAVLFDLDV